jgi:hypothetical protein
MCSDIITNAVPDEKLATDYARILLNGDVRSTVRILTKVGGHTILLVEFVIAMFSVNELRAWLHPAGETESGADGEFRAYLMPTEPF